MRFDLDDVLAIECIKQLKHEYCLHLDEGNVVPFRDVFTDEFTYDPSSSDEKITDDGGLREWFDWRSESFPYDGELLAIERSTHVAMNPIISVDGRRASGAWNYFVVIEYEEGLVEFGHGVYDDEYRIEDDEWKISSSTTIHRRSIEIEKSA